MENKQIIQALLSAQKEMGNALKDSTNPFFKSKYADLNSVREACIPILNKHEIVVLQPTVFFEGKNFIKTILMHVSGEAIESLTEIIYSKQNDAQSQGSGITYSRRYGLQSLINIGADDDDGNKSSQSIQKKEIKEKKILEQGSDAFIKAVEYINNGGSIDDIEKKYTISETVKLILIPN